MLLLVGSQRVKNSVTADQKRCPRLAQGPLLVSSIGLPWVVNLVSPSKPDTARHPQNLQGRGSSGDLSPENMASGSNIPPAPTSSRRLAWRGQRLSKAARKHISTPAGQGKKVPPEIPSAEGSLGFLSYPGTTNLRATRGPCINGLQVSGVLHIQ